MTTSLVGIAIGTASALLHDGWVRACVRRRLSAGPGLLSAPTRVVTVASSLFATVSLGWPCLVGAVLAFAATRQFLTIREARR